MSIKVDTGIPLPPPNHRNKENCGKAKYPFYEMSVGDSFFVKGVGSTTLLSAARNYNKGKAFKVRYWVEGGEVGARIWRVA